MKHFYIAFFTFVLIGFQKAQPYSVSIPTVNSTNNWNVKIKTKVDFSSNANTLGHSFMKDFVNYTVNLTSCYYGPGILPVLTTIKDSVEIGFLPIGNYTLNYTVYSSIGTDGCTPYDTIINSYTFHVGPTSIDEFEIINNLQLVPNPIKDHFTIKSGYENLYLNKISVFNTIGQKVIEYEDPKFNSEIQIDIPSGIYFLEINSGVKSRIVKFIKE